MTRCWVFLLLIGTVSAASYADSPLDYNEVRKLAVQEYNGEPYSQFIFRQWPVYLESPWDPLSSEIQSFPLDIKETVCDKADVYKCELEPTKDPDPAPVYESHPIRGTVCFRKVDIETCDFKPDGVIKSCLGSYRYENEAGSPPIAAVNIKCKTK